MEFSVTDPAIYQQIQVQAMCRRNNIFFFHFHGTFYKPNTFHDNKYIIMIIIMIIIIIIIIIIIKMD